MRPLVLVALVGLLAACATERERCASAATRDLRVVNALIEESRAVLDRGYAVRREPVARPRLQLCYGRGNRGVGVSFCNSRELGYDRVPQAVNLEAERAQLDSLLAKRAELRAEARRDLAACTARYPQI